MPRNPVPLQLLKGTITKEERERRAEKEQKINEMLKSDQVQPPEWLDNEGRKYFLYIVEQFEDSKMLTNLDVNALATYCDLHSRRLSLLQEVREKGSVLKNKNSRGGVTHVQNPALTALNTTIKLLQQYESKFGLTVFDRTKIALKEQEEQSKKLTEEEILFGDTV